MSDSEIISSINRVSSEVRSLKTKLDDTDKKLSNIYEILKEIAYNTEK